MDDYGIVVADRTGIIQMWSRGAEGLFGHSREEAVGQSLDLVVPEKYREAHWNGFHRAMETGVAGAEGESVELPVNCKSGIRKFPGTFRLVRDKDNAVIGAMLICTASAPGEGTAEA
jgi:PAS domain S-box-containing protein